MKKIYVMFVMAASMLSSTVMAQENRSFAEISVGTQAKDHQFLSEKVKSFHGANISLEVGHDFNGLSASLSFGYFGNDWSGKHQASTHYYSELTQDQPPKVASSNNVIRSDDRYSSVEALSLMANVSYDVLRFIKGNWRHHIRPRVGLGYSHFGASHFSYMTASQKMASESGSNSTYYNSYYNNLYGHGNSYGNYYENFYDPTSGVNVVNEKTSDSGFEWSLGIGYDFSITRDWSIGLQYEKYMSVRDQYLLGLRARYAF